MGDTINLSFGGDRQTYYYCSLSSLLKLSPLSPSHFPPPLQRTGEKGREVGGKRRKRERAVGRTRRGGRGESEVRSSAGTVVLERELFFCTSRYIGVERKREDRERGCNRRSERVLLEDGDASKQTKKHRPRGGEEEGSHFSPAFPLPSCAKAVSSSYTYATTTTVKQSTNNTHAQKKKIDVCCSKACKGGSKKCKRKTIWNGVDTKGGGGGGGLKGVSIANQTGPRWGTRGKGSCRDFRIVQYSEPAFNRSIRTKRSRKIGTIRW